MRKKLLRSRSGFEKPESREEAIMQNILGASNVLEPSESNIEEILKSILYNTPYTKEAEFEIEKILLAIKNNGTYDGEGESRDMKILIAILNNLDYTEEAESRIEELFIEWLQQRQQIKVLEGVPPLIFTSRGLPLINYLIEGNTVQNGTPTPDNPVMPEGTGERTGNLLDASNFALIQVTTTAYRYGTSLGVLPQGIYTFNATKSAGAQSIYLTAKLNGVYSQTTISSVPFSFTADGNSEYIIRTADNTGTTWEAKNYSDMMLNLGSTAKPYEPYGYKIPILSAGQTTPIYLGEVETTRKIKKLVIDGTENWNEGTSNYYILINISGRGEGIPNSTALSTHTESGVVVNNNGTTLFFKKSVFVHSSLADFKTYLQQQYAAGTPVTVWYVLAEPETGVVNEPLMKIVEYADTVSMEQAGVQIPTNNGTTVIDVDTTVKPSNVYIEYK